MVRIYVLSNLIYSHHNIIFIALELQPCEQNGSTIKCNNGQCLFSKDNNYQTCMLVIVINYIIISMLNKKFHKFPLFKLHCWIYRRILRRESFRRLELQNK